MELDATVLARPLDQVWPEVLRLLAAGGFPLTGADADAVAQPARFLDGLFTRARETVVDGDGRRLDTGWGPGRIRYHVEGVPAEGGCRVRFFAAREDHTEHNRDADTHRDPDLELALLERVDPEAAARVRASQATPR